MNREIKQKFGLGDTVYYAICNAEEVRVLCPTCFGKKEVTLILGNDEKVLLPCAGCCSGYDLPSGYINEIKWGACAKQIIIDRIVTVTTGNKETTTYYSGDGRFNECDLFVCKDSALRRAEEKKEKFDRERLTKNEHIKHNIYKSFSWNASYHMGRIKQHEKDIEHHKNMAKLCKERVRGDK